MNDAVRSTAAPDAQRHARCLAALRRIAWDVERDLIRSRRPDFSRRFVPDALTSVGELGFLRPDQARRLSQLQACTYAHSAVRVARCVAAVTLRGGEAHWCGDAVALQTHVRVADDALKHQTLFRRLASMTLTGLPQGYRFDTQDDGLSRTVLRRGGWAAQALVLALVLSAQAHYRHSLDAAGTLCPLWEDVFLFHWKEASQHTVLIELAWQEAHARGGERDQQLGVVELGDLIDELAPAVQRQADSDAQFFAQVLSPGFGETEAVALRDLLRRAYRYRFIGSGLSEPRFINMLRALVPGTCMQRLSARLAPWTSETGT